MWVLGLGVWNERNERKDYELIYIVGLINIDVRTKSKNDKNWIDVLLNVYKIWK